MTRTFNAELLKYSGDQELLATIDELWMKCRKIGDPFLHELAPRTLTILTQMFEQLLNGMTLVPTKDYREEQERSLDTTRRLSYALGFMQGLVDRKRGFSRSALRGWIATLSVPLEGRKTEEVMRELDEAPDMEGDDWLRHAREHFEEFKGYVTNPSLSGPTSLSDMPPHVAIGRIEQGMLSLSVLVNMVLLFMEKVDGESKEVGKVLADFNKDMAELNTKSTTKPQAVELTGAEKLEQHHRNLILFRDEVFPKLYDLMNAYDKVGDMNRSELLALSACLDVAIKARNNKRL